MSWFSLSSLIAFIPYWVLEGLELVAPVESLTPSKVDTGTQLHYLDVILSQSVTERSSPISVEDYSLMWDSHFNTIEDLLTTLYQVMDNLANDGVVMGPPGIIHRTTFLEFFRVTKTKDITLYHRRLVRSVETLLRYLRKEDHPIGWMLRLAWLFEEIERVIQILDGRNERDLTDTLS